MTDVTQQLAEAIRGLLRHSGVADAHYQDKSEEDHSAERSARQALTAFEASRAAPDDVVERVAKAIGARHEAGYVIGSLYSENMRELARAALSAMPRDEGLEALRELSERATKGEWRMYHAPLRKNFPTPITEVQVGEMTPVVSWGGFDDSSRKPKQHKANAALIAAAVNYVRNKLSATDRGEG